MDKDPVTAPQHECESNGIPLEADPSNALLAASNAIGRELAQLRQDFQARLAYDQAKEQAFDQLYAELNQCRADTAYEQLRPLFIDLILLFDRVHNAAKSEASEGASTSTSAQLLESFRDELLEILYRREIELIEPSSPWFDRSYQRAIGTERTDVVEDDNRVVRVVRRGFKYRTRIVRAEEVIVKKVGRSTE